MGDETFYPEAAAEQRAEREGAEMGYHCGACSDAAGRPVIFSPDEYARHKCPTTPEEMRKPAAPFDIDAPIRPGASTMCADPGCPYRAPHFHMATVVPLDLVPSSFGGSDDPWVQIVNIVTSQPDWDEEEADGPEDIVAYIRDVCDARARQVIQGEKIAALARACPDHDPVQHRDGKPPWCRHCGLTAAFTEPVSALGERPCTMCGSSKHPTHLHEPV